MIQKNLPQSFDRQEVRAIISGFASDRFVSKGSSYKHSYYAPFIKILAYTGCRPEEAIALTSSDIIERDGRMFISINKAFSKGILLPSTKSRKSRHFPCNSQLSSLINSITLTINPIESKLLFPSQEGSYINLDNFRRRYWQVVLRGLVGIGEVKKYLKLYCLRHSYITYLIREGFDVATVAYVVGSSPRMIMDHYTSPAQDVEIPEV